MVAHSQARLVAAAAPAACPPAMARILVVDDSATIRRLLSATLTAAGFEVLEAEDGVCGLGVLETTAVDLIITDLNMPRLNGLGLVEQVRRNGRRRTTPILVFTTEGDERQRERGLEAGASAWMLKPINPAALLGMIRVLLGGYASSSMSQ
jgi:two-component system, chemotaxis family, chemotaxis protein CheY